MYAEYRCFKGSSQRLDDAEGFSDVREKTVLKL